MKNPLPMKEIQSIFNIHTENGSKQQIIREMDIKAIEVPPHTYQTDKDD